MEDTDASEIMTIVLGTIARVHALELSVNALMASHPYPEVALQVWDGLHPSVAEYGFSKAGSPEYSEVLRRLLAEHRAELCKAVDAARKAGR